MQVKITRRPGFDEPIDFQFDWTPPGVQAQPTMTVRRGRNQAVLRLFAGPSAQPGTWQVAATATTTGGSYYLGAGRIRVSSAFVDLTIAEPYVALKNKPAAVRRGETSQVVWDVEHKKPFAGEAEAVLLGLPKGVTTVEPTPKLKTGDEQLVFEVAARPRSAAGTIQRADAARLSSARPARKFGSAPAKAFLRVDPALNCQRRLPPE